jgi:hypothetical protein
MSDFKFGDQVSVLGREGIFTVVGHGRECEDGTAGEVVVKSLDTGKRYGPSADKLVRIPLVAEEEPEICFRGFKFQVSQVVSGTDFKSGKTIYRAICKVGPEVALDKLQGVKVRQDNSGFWVQIPMEEE